MADRRPPSQGRRHLRAGLNAIGLQQLARLNKLAAWFRSECKGKALNNEKGVR